MTLVSDQHLRHFCARLAAAGDEYWDAMLSNGRKNSMVAFENYQAILADIKALLR